MKLCKPVRYVKHGGKYGNAEGVFAPGGHWVFKRNVERAIAGLETNGESIDWTKPHKTEVVLGKVLYKSYSVIDRRQIGHTISYFIWQDLLSKKLKCANPDVRGTRTWISADVTLKPTIKRIRIVYRDAAQLKQLMTHKPVCSISARDLQPYPASHLPAS